MCKKIDNFEVSLYLPIAKLYNECDSPFIVFVSPRSYTIRFHPNKFTTVSVTYVHALEKKNAEKILTVTGAVCDVSGVGILRIKPGKEPGFSCPCCCQDAFPLEQKQTGVRKCLYDHAYTII